MKILIAIVAFFICRVAIADNGWSPQQQEVVTAVEGYLNAWNSGDAELPASFCDVACDRIDARGNIYEGRDGILDNYTRVFSKPPPSGVERFLSYEIFSVKFATPDVSVVDANYALRGAPTDPPLTVRGMNTVVLVNKDGRWLRFAHRQRIPILVEDVLGQQELKDHE